MFSVRSRFKKSFVVPILVSSVPSLFPVYGLPKPVSFDNGDRPTVLQISSIVLFWSFIVPMRTLQCAFPNQSVTHSGNFLFDHVIVRIQSIVPLLNRWFSERCFVAKTYAWERKERIIPTTAVGVSFCTKARRLCLCLPESY